jgi:lipopolysaccharide biosynthesis protein
MRRLAVFAHYDAQGEIKPYVHFYLRALRPHCERIVFVSTATLSPATLGTLDGLCDETALRQNSGFDFGMWQHAIVGTDLGPFDELLLANSSVFGPLWPLDRVFDRMAGEECDFWGITDNYEFHWHLQSYFLCFRRRVLESEAFSRFWSSVLPYRDKLQAIMSYELGLSQLLVEAGMRPKALVPCDSLFPEGPARHLHRHKRRNPTCYHPMRVLNAGSPFVKVELLRDNPVEISLRGVYHEMLRLGYDRSLIAFDRPVHKKGLRE